jgi:N6-adenosine-specific RNA methylase IME4
MKYRTIVADPPWPYQDGPLPGFGPGRLPNFLPYASMDLEAIRVLPIAPLAAPAAHLYLWTTNHFLWDAKPIAEEWGVKVSQVLVWCKAPMGLGPGSAFANTTEFVLFGRCRVGALIERAREDVGLSRGNLHRALFDTNPTGIVYRWEADDCLPKDEDWDRLRSLLPGLSLVEDLAPEPQRHLTSWWQWKRGEHSAKPEAFLDLVERVSPGPYLELFARRNRLGWDTWGNEALEHVTLEATP